MNCQAFTNDSLTMMYEAIRGALAADDALKRQGLAIPFRVRETPDWKKHAADLESETRGALRAFPTRVLICLVNGSPRSRRLWRALGWVPLTTKREGFRSSFSAKSTSFYAGQDLAIPSNSGNTFSVRAPDVSRTNRATMRAVNQAQSVPVDMRG
jgi:hypothetical protein